MATTVPTRLRPWAWSFALGSVVSGCGGPERYTYIERLGTDTTSIEEFARTPEGFEGRVLVRIGGTRVAHYQATVDSLGRVTRFEEEWTTPAEQPDGPATTRSVMTFGLDSVTVERIGGNNAGTTTLAAPLGTMPEIAKTPVSFGLLDHALRQIDASATEYTIVRSGAPRPSQHRLIRESPTRVGVDYFGDPIQHTLDADGRIATRSGIATTNKVEGERVAGTVDFDRLAAEFAARDARGEGLGSQASPPGSAEFNAAGVHIAVEYHRPAKRGREIFGGIVPFGQVWRTGANNATSFSTSRDILIGDVQVPAGDYTMFSIFTQDGGELIINRQTGQWGTVYDEAQDLARIPMQREAVSEIAERFTIGFAPRNDGATLTLTWDTTRFSVPIVTP